MISKVLQRARDFESKYLPYTVSELPMLHVTGGIGWINDPNGFAPYKGEYHLFFQYYPYDTKWGPMHWGHVKTRDFIKWERLPTALAPDTEYDRDGCFSGSAVELPDGRHLLMYTGVRNTRRRNGRGRKHRGFSRPEDLAGKRPVLRRHREPLRGQQRDDPPVRKRGRSPLAVCERAFRLPQSVRPYVGVPGFLPPGREERAAGQPAGHGRHRP